MVYISSNITLCIQPYFLLLNELWSKVAVSGDLRHRVAVIYVIGLFHAVSRNGGRCDVISIFKRPVFITDPNTTFANSI